MSLSKKHQKHANITKSVVGFFHRNELSILGTPCGEIKSLVAKLSAKLSVDYSLGYVDADHKSGDDANNLSGSMLGKGVQQQYTDKIDYHRFDRLGQPNDFDFRAHFANQDLVLVNGNHAEANAQIIVIDPKKSLEKKLHKLTNVVLVLLQEGVSEVPDYLKQHINDFDELIQLSVNDVDQIASLVHDRMQLAEAKVNGLVLMGGKSERMKRDKSEIQYHGMTQKKYMFGLLDAQVDQTYYAVRAGQSTGDVARIEDSFTGLGPFGAILSAFRKNPNVAWLVVACDQPFITKETIAFLLSKRNTSKLATAFFNPKTDFPEPLMTIWEPRAYGRLLHFLSLGYSCPRKVLIHSEIELVKLGDDSVLDNANTPEEYEAAVKRLRH